MGSSGPDIHIDQGSPKTGPSLRGRIRSPLLTFGAFVALRRDRIESRRQLFEEHNVRIESERASQSRPLSHATAQRRGQHVFRSRHTDRRRPHAYQERNRRGVELTR